MIGNKTKFALLMIGALSAPAALSTDDCEPFRKQVSVDGGVTWFDADTVAAAPSAGFGTVVEYRFIVKNCETNKDCFDTVIDDPTLGITNADVPDGDDDTITPGEEITITKTDAGFENLLQPDRCDTPGDKLNTATESTFLEGGGLEQMMNDAWVRCDSEPPAKLGDRVWEDVDGDGVQDCADDNGNGIIGDAGDSGDECGAGIPNVPVTLLQGDCATEVSSTTTDGNGFYLFDELAAGDYCVRFDEPTDPDFCDAPGGPAFTLANIGGDASDSDADATGTTDPTSLAAGETNRTIDAGIYCPAALGDRVFEDLDTDGVQDCSDDNGNGVLGDAGDSGSECDAGIPNVPVNLLEGDCATVVDMTTTDSTGFYGFENLAPGDYCVEFGLPPASFCDTDGFVLGAPAFTESNAGINDAADSDAGPGGTSDPTSLFSGQVDPTLDAGVVCPAKIGDFVFEDTNENGMQDGGEMGVPGVKTTLFECGPDMVAGTSDDVPTGEMRVTDSMGMYMYGGEPGVFDLPPGKYFVQFDPETLPPGFGFTMPNVGDDATNSDCLPDDGISACTVLPSGAVNLARDCGIVPPPPPDCALTLDKSCAVLPPPPQDFDKCDGKLQQFTVIWNGADGTAVSGPGFSGSVGNGQAVTFTGPFSNNDVEVTINGVEGASIFHVSCSDEDFNDPSDCGKMAGNGKGNDAGLINDWQLEGFVDSDGRVLNCSPVGGGEFADNCEYLQPELPSCENGEKPDNLTRRYDGGTGGDGDCA
ncbi:MAG: hypothetical protein KJO82_12305, partial [Gammaproteobacteria bacterium]|nr:hypothetical protein [Gammaproteobacteria bacterium]